MTGSKLLALVFAIDVTRCRNCGLKLNVERFEIVTDLILVARLLLALGLYGKAPARAPPRDTELFDDIDHRYYEAD